MVWIFFNVVHMLIGNGIITPSDEIIFFIGVAQPPPGMDWCPCEGITMLSIASYNQLYGIWQIYVDISN